MIYLNIIIFIILIVGFELSIKHSIKKLDKDIKEIKDKIINDASNSNSSSNI